MGGASSSTAPGGMGAGPPPPSKGPLPADAPPMEEWEKTFCLTLNGLLQKGKEGVPMLTQIHERLQAKGKDVKGILQRGKANGLLADSGTKGAPPGQVPPPAPMVPGGQPGGPAIGAPPGGPMRQLTQPEKGKIVTQLKGKGKSHADIAALLPRMLGNEGRTNSDAHKQSFPCPVYQDYSLVPCEHLVFAAM